MKTYRRLLLLIPALLLSFNAVKAQSRFKIEGKVNVDTGTATLYPMGAQGYYPGNPQGYTTHIDKGHFTFEDTCTNPYGFRIIIKQNPVSTYVSDYFIVEPGLQQISCNYDATWRIPEVSNKSTLERKNDLMPQFVPLDRFSDSIQARFYSLGKSNSLTPAIINTYYHQYDSIGRCRKLLLKDYIMDHPDSYAALWQLVFRLGQGYDELYQQAYDQLLPALQSSYTGQVLKHRLAETAKTAIGAQFPSLALADINNKPLKLLAGAQERYTLVDFWFSHCPACIGEFDAYKKIYAEYKDLGFTIKGVSTDDASMIPAWKGVIAKYQLPWPQFLDLAGVNASRLSISSFPMNFLLDSEGRIIRRDLSTAELAQFLSVKLK